MPLAELASDAPEREQSKRASAITVAARFAVTAMSEPEAGQQNATKAF